TTKRSHLHAARSHLPRPPPQAYRGWPLIALRGTPETRAGADNPHMRRRRNLLTQVLVVNLLLVVAAVIAASLATNPGIDLRENPAQGMVLGLFVSLTVLVNVFLLQRRFRPLERLVDQMERADLSRPGANLR